MADSTLTEDQALSLLRKLATDDDFRALFETKPAKALHNAGIPADTIVDLSARCIAPRSLAPKKEFADIVERMDREALHAAMSMVVPQIKLSGR